MDFFSGISEFLSRDTTEWFSSVLGFMVAANIVATLITFPEWQIVQIDTMGIYLRSVT